MQQNFNKNKDIKLYRMQLRLYSDNYVDLWDCIISKDDN